jgi:hypothetical protein
MRYADKGLGLFLFGVLGILVGIGTIGNKLGHGARSSAVMSAPALAAEPAPTPKSLPACDDPAVKDGFLKTVRPSGFYELKDWQGSGTSADKRWCYAFFAGGYGLGYSIYHAPFMEAVFTLEWVNEADGRWWLQIREARETCRGVMGDPNSEERCGDNILRKKWPAK